jgi:Plasmid pRiA4b ORF-3-like protein
MAKKKPAGNIFQLKISLRDIEPSIWRRVLVEDCTLAALHGIIQNCMGWDDDHMHAFEVRGETYSHPDLDDAEDEIEMTLGQIAEGRTKKFTYTYDFGDDWRHVIQIEKRLPAEEGVRYPRCVDGQRAGPPEDCGGPWGYSEILEILQNPKHPDYKERKEWLGRKYDPEACNLDAINRELGSSGK